MPFDSGALERLVGATGEGVGGVWTGIRDVDLPCGGSDRPARRFRVRADFVLSSLQLVQSLRSLIMSPFLSTFLLGSGVWLALLCALMGLGFAYYLVRSVISCSPGNDRMRQVASAVEEGAKAYLHRQLVSVGLIAAVIFVILIFARGFYTSIGFLLGGAYSMAAGYIGMRIAVLSNSRTAQAAMTSKHAALRVAFN